MTRAIVEALSAIHDRSTFASGVEPLDRYFREHVTQDIRRRLTNCFVAVERGGASIVGYYTFAAASIPTNHLPQETTKRLPRYTALPAGLVGRLAIDHRFRGQGFGSALIADAVQRAIRAEPAIFALLVDAKDDKAMQFYGHHGFHSLTSSPNTMFLPIGTAKKIISGEH